MKGKTINQKRKTALKNAIKDVFLFLLVCFAYFLSVYINGFAKTNKNLIELVIFSLIGYVGFYVIYYLIYGISALKNKKYQKKRDELFEKYKDCSIENNLNDKPFIYDTDKGIKENLESLRNVCITNLNDIALSCGCKGKYACFSFTIIDALKFTNKTLHIFEEKVDEILSKVGFLNLEDKPISFVEKYVDNLTKTDKPEGNGLIKSIFKKPVAYALKIVCEEKINNAVNYLLVEGYMVYSKNTKNLQKLEKTFIENLEENQIEGAV